MGLVSDTGYEVRRLAARLIAMSRVDNGWN